MPSHCGYRYPSYYCIGAYIIGRHACNDRYERALTNLPEIHPLPPIYYRAAARTSSSTCQHVGIVGIYRFTTHMYVTLNKRQRDSIHTKQVGSNKVKSHATVGTLRQINHAWSVPDFLDDCLDWAPPARHLGPAPLQRHREEGRWGC